MISRALVSLVCYGASCGCHDSFCYHNASRRCHDEVWRCHDSLKDYHSVKIPASVMIHAAVMILPWS